MLTKSEARALVVAELGRQQERGYASAPKDLVVVDEATIERPWGWVFFYNSKRFLETRDFLHALAGNAPPFIVNRHTGEMRATGTAYRTEHYIAEYERSLR
jgi:hypothetical protein